MSLAIKPSASRRVGRTTTTRCCSSERRPAAGGQLRRLDSRSFGIGSGYHPPATPPGTPGGGSALLLIPGRRATDQVPAAPRDAADTDGPGPTPGDLRRLRTPDSGRTAARGCRPSTPYLCRTGSLDRLDGDRPGLLPAAAEDTPGRSGAEDLASLLATRPPSDGWVADSRAAPSSPTQALPPPRGGGHDSRRVVNRCACVQSAWDL